MGNSSYVDFAKFFEVFAGLFNFSDQFGPPGMRSDMFRSEEIQQARNKERLHLDLVAKQFPLKVVLRVDHPALGTQRMGNGITELFILY